MAEVVKISHMERDISGFSGDCRKGQTIKKKVKVKAGRWMRSRWRWQSKRTLTDESESVPDDGLIASLSQSPVTLRVCACACVCGKTAESQKLRTSEAIRRWGIFGEDSHTIKPTGSETLSIWPGLSAAGPHKNPSMFSLTHPFHRRSDTHLFIFFAAEKWREVEDGSYLQLFTDINGFHTSENMHTTTPDVHLVNCRSWTSFPSSFLKPNTHPQPGTHASVCAPPPDIFIELMDNNDTGGTGQGGGPPNMVVANRASYIWSDEETELCLFFFLNKRHNLMCLWEGEKSIEMLTYLNQWWKGCTTWVLLPFHHCYK